MRAAIALLCGCVGGALAVVMAWYFGDTSISEADLVRFLPVSDAQGYHLCATSLSIVGDFGVSADWCSRRVLYPTMLASLLSWTGWSSHGALLLQGAITGLSIGIFALSTRALFGVFVATITAALLGVYAWEFVIGLFMTEVPGFVFGLLGLSLLLTFSETNRWTHLFIGCALLSLGMTARAGAVLVLPATVAWTFLVSRGNLRFGKALYGSAAITGILAGSVVQICLAWALGGNPLNTGGNFSTSLYGLSTGSRDWTEAYKHFDWVFKQSENAAFEQVYAAAIQNILQAPGVFLTALAQAALFFLRYLFGYGVVEYANPILSALAALGIVRCLLSIRSPWASLLLILAAAELLTAPLIADSGGNRIFAATIAIRTLLCALGLQVILGRIRIAFGRPANTGAQSNDKQTIAAATMTGLVVFLTMAAPAVAPKPAAARWQELGPGCPEGLNEVISRVGRESQFVISVDRHTSVESLSPFRFGRQRLLNDARLAYSWSEALLSPPRSVSLLRAVNLSPARFGRIEPLVFIGELPTSDRPISFCTKPGSHLHFGNIEHQLIVHTRPL